MKSNADYYRDFLVGTANALLNAIKELNRLIIADRKSRLKIQQNISAEYMKLSDSLPQFYERIAKDFITPLERSDLYAIAVAISSSVRECNLLAKSICSLRSVNVSFLSNLSKLVRQTERYGVFINDILKKTELFKKYISVSVFAKKLSDIKNETDKAYTACLSSAENGNAEKLMLYAMAKKCCTLLEEAADKAIDVAIKNI